jgi:hypothetical protein
MKELVLRKWVKAGAKSRTNEVVKRYVEYIREKIKA